MKPTHALKTAFMLTVLCLAGCKSRGLDRLLGNEPDRNESGQGGIGGNIQGIWSGTIHLDGRDQNFHFNLVQNGSAITDHSYVSIDYTGTLMATVTGTVNGSNVTMSADDGSRCPNHWQADAQVNGPTMTVHFYGQGNNVPGTSCYPSPIDTTLTLTHG